MSAMKLKELNPYGQIYISPSVDILEVRVEGVLCESGISINDWENDDELLDFD